MWPDRVSSPRPLTYESGALPTALRGPAIEWWKLVSSTDFTGKVIQNKRKRLSEQNRDYMKGIVRGMDIQ